MFTSLAGDEIAKISYLEGKNLSYIFLVTVIIAPLLETFVFQYFIIEVVLFIFKKFSFPFGINCSVIFSSIMFGLAHSYNVYYVLNTFLVGVLYALFYLMARKRRDISGYITVTSVHVYNNLFVFVMMDLLNLSTT
ncbi:hypothetical protein GCM10028791_42380 [Echinicola sediminis]